MCVAGGDDSSWQWGRFFALVCLVLGLWADRVPCRTSHHSQLQRARHTRTASARSSSLHFVSRWLGSPCTSFHHRSHSSHRRFTSSGQLRFNALPVNFAKVSRFKLFFFCAILPSVSFMANSFASCFCVLRLSSKSRHRCLWWGRWKWQTWNCSPHFNN